MKTGSEKDDCNMEVVGPNKTRSKQRLDKMNASIHLPSVKNFRKIEVDESPVLYRPDLARSEAIEKLVPLKPKRLQTPKPLKPYKP